MQEISTIGKDLDRTNVVLPLDQQRFLSMEKTLVPEFKPRRYVFFLSGISSNYGPTMRAQIFPQSACFSICRAKSSKVWRKIDIRHLFAATAVSQITGIGVVWAKFFQCIWAVSSLAPLYCFDSGFKANKLEFFLKKKLGVEFFCLV